ncbi:MAG: AtpZ/AtpI family protein [Candidatus Saccharimonas sp.]
MSNNSNQGNRKGSPTVTLMLSMADTTWRMFVPTIGLLLLGRLADESWHIKPFGMIAGIVIGSLIAAWLVKQQLQKEV